jgi:hypothetical protein
MDFFEGTDWAEALLPRRLVRRIAQLACVVLMTAFAIAPQQTSAWLMRQGQRHEKQIDPFIANISKLTVPTTAATPPDRQSRNR